MHSQPVLPESSLFVPLSTETLLAVENVKQANGWQEKYRQIMLLGKQLPSLSVDLKQSNAQVKGCESQAWLYHYQVNDQHFYIADSDARIVKGLITLLLSATNGKTSAQIMMFDLESFFEQLGLKGQLSPSRTNGLLALANAINNMAQTT